MRGYTRSRTPRLSTWSPTDVLLTFLFLVLFGALIYGLGVLDKLR